MTKKIEKGTEVFLGLAKLIVRVEEVWFLEPMPFVRAESSGYYFNGRVIQDLNPRGNRVLEWCKCVSIDAISGIVANPKSDNKAWFPVKSNSQSNRVES